MDIPGWIFMVVGGIVTAISGIIFLKQGTFQLFIFIGIVFLTYGIYKTIIDRTTSKLDTNFNSDLKQYSRETSLKDLPIGQQLYYRQHYNQQTNPPPQQGVRHPAQQAVRQPQHHQYPVCPRCRARQTGQNFCGNCGMRLR
jgi:hypothetical protein